MVHPSERATDRLPLAELERRWAALREIMAEARVDALLTQGANHANGVGGASRWITGQAVYGSYPETVLFLRDGPMIKVGHGAFGQVADFDGRNPGQPGTGRRLGSPTFPAVNYCDGYDAALIAGEIRRLRLRRVALISPGSFYWGFGRALMAELPQVEFGDLTEQVDHLRAIKSAEEITLLRRAAAMQDQILAEVPRFLRPGLTDFQAMAHGHFAGAMAGSATGYFLGGSAPPDQPAGMNPRQMQGRVIREGDVVVYQPENSGPGGYFVHACRIFVLGKAPQELVDLWGAMVEAQDHTASLLKPGAAPAEIFAEHNAWMAARGYDREARLHAHSQGYDVVERPLVRQDETMSIAAGMNIGIHPRTQTATAFATVCDNFLTLPDGTVERLHRSPREIVEL